MHIKKLNHKLVKPKSEEGFTLVELMVTIFILSVIITSLGGLYYIMQIIEVRSQHLDLAIRAARTEIEDLRNDGYNSLTPGTVSFTSSLPSRLPPNKNGQAVISSPEPDLRRIDVTITYSDYGIPQTVTLSSDIGIIGIGQT